MRDDSPGKIMRLKCVFDITGFLLGTFVFRAILAETSDSLAAGIFETAHPDPDPNPDPAVTTTDFDATNDSSNDATIDNILPIDKRYSNGDENDIEKSERRRPLNTQLTVDKVDTQSHHSQQRSVAKADRGEGTLQRHERISKAIKSFLRKKRISLGDLDDDTILKLRKMYHAHPASRRRWRKKKKKSSRDRGRSQRVHSFDTKSKSSGHYFYGGEEEQEENLAEEGNKRLSFKETLVGEGLTKSEGDRTKEIPLKGVRLYQAQAKKQHKKGRKKTPPEEENIHLAGPTKSKGGKKAGKLAQSDESSELAKTRRKDGEDFQVSSKKTIAENQLRSKTGSSKATLAKKAGAITRLQPAEKAGQKLDSARPGVQLPRHKTRTKGEQKKEKIHARRRPIIRPDAGSVFRNRFKTEFEDIQVTSKSDTLPPESGPRLAEIPEQEVVSKQMKEDALLVDPKNDEKTEEDYHGRTAEIEIEVSENQRQRQQEVGQSFSSSSAASPLPLPLSPLSSSSLLSSSSSSVNVVVQEPTLSSATDRYHEETRLSLSERPENDDLPGPISHSAIDETPPSQLHETKTELFTNDTKMINHSTDESKRKSALSNTHSPDVVKAFNQFLSKLGKKPNAKDKGLHIQKPVSAAESTEGVIRGENSTGHQHSASIGKDVASVKSDDGDPNKFLQIATVGPPHSGDRGASNGLKVKTLDTKASSSTSKPHWTYPGTKANAKSSELKQQKLSPSGPAKHNDTDDLRRKMLANLKIHSGSVGSRYPPEIVTKKPGKANNALRAQLPASKTVNVNPLPGLNATAVLLGMNAGKHLQILERENKTQTNVIDGNRLRPSGPKDNSHKVDDQIDARGLDTQIGTPARKTQNPAESETNDVKNAAEISRILTSLSPPNVSATGRKHVLSSVKVIGKHEAETATDSANNSRSTKSFTAKCPQGRRTGGRVISIQEPTEQQQRHELFSSGEIRRKSGQREITSTSSLGALDERVFSLPLPRPIPAPPLAEFWPFRGNASLWVGFRPGGDETEDSGTQQTNGSDLQSLVPLTFFRRDFMSSKSFLASLGVVTTVMVFCLFFCVCGLARWYRQRQYRKAFDKMEENFSGLDTDKPLYLRLAQLRRCKAGNQYVVAVVDDSKFSVVDHDLESEDEIFNVTDIRTADKKGPLSRLQWTSQNTPY